MKFGVLAVQGTFTEHEKILARIGAEPVKVRLAEQGIQHVALHTTEVGQPLYEELGFVNGNEMKLRLR